MHGRNQTRPRGDWGGIPIAGAWATAHISVACDGTPPDPRGHVPDARPHAFAYRAHYGRPTVRHGGTWSTPPRTYGGGRAMPGCASGRGRRGVAFHSPSPLDHRGEKTHRGEEARRGWSGFSEGEGGGQVRSRRWPPERAGRGDCPVPGSGTPRAVSCRAGASGCGCAPIRHMFLILSMRCLHMYTPSAYSAMTAAKHIHDRKLLNQNCWAMGWLTYR